MLVFNLTNNPVVYRTRTIPPEGSFEFTDLDFIPDRDKGLEKANILSFGARPRTWKSSQPGPLTAEQVKKLTALPEVLPTETIKVKDEARVEEKVELGFKKKKY